MDPTPLPENPFPASAFRAAYDQCLTFEAEASDVEPVEGCPPPIVCARLLGHLLRLARPGNPQGQLQREIASSRDYATLMKLAAFYLNGFLRAFKRSSGPTPAPSDHPSRPSFEDVRDYSMALMDECKLNHRSARNLVRFRIAVTCSIVILDRQCVVIAIVAWLLAWRIINNVKAQVIVQTTHIIPESTNTNREPGRKRSQPANVWSILSMFSWDNIIEDLAGNRVHRLENIISLNSTSHQFFDELQLWLKPMEGAPHGYCVCTAKDSLRRHPPLPEYVTLSTTLPLPNPEYLAIHALCCEVAWMSGAAEHIMDVERRMDDTEVLANDGSNVDLLMTALSFVAKA